MAIAQHLATVLLLSDDPETRAATAAVLEEAGYAVTQVSAEEARACVLERPVDVILLDLSDPEVAAETARQLRAVCVAPFVPLLRLTAEEEARPLAESLETGAYAALSKPVAPPVLLTMMSTLARLGRAYRETHQERTRLEEVLSQLPSGVVIADAEGRLQATNERAREILCLPEVPASQEERVRTLRPAQQGALAGIERWPLWRALRTGERVIGEEFEITCGDGRKITARVSAAPVRSPEGEIIAGVLTFTDITERARTERALRESRTRLQRLYESKLLGVLAYTLDGRITEANDAFLEMVGYTREDLEAGRLNWKELTPPEGAARDEQAVTELRAQGVHIPYEKAYLRKDGSRVPVLIGAAATGVGHESVIAFVLDISARKQAEEEREALLAEVERQRTFLAAFLDNSPTAMAYLDTSLRFVRVNRAYAEWTGLPPEQLVGRTHFEVWRAEERVETMRQALATGEPVRRSEVPITYPARFRRPDGYVNYAVFPVKGGQGRVIGLVLSAEDATERVRAREQTVAAERARAELAETLNTEVNHRVKNNLAMAAGLLQMQSAEEPDERVTSVLHDAASRLLTFAQVHEQLQVSTAGRVDLLAGIRRLTEATRDALATRGVEFTVEGECVELSAQAATNMLIVANELITNAAKYCQPATGDESCAVAVGVRVGLALHEGKLVLSVWNSGNPVPEDFDLTRAPGMGLRLVWALVVDQCRGTFSLRPHEGGTLAEAAVELDQLGLHCGA